MTESEIRALYGWAEIDPAAPIVAGSVGTWRITYHTGRYGVDDGGVIKFAWRDVSDWAAPQFDDPAAQEYAALSLRQVQHRCGQSLKSNVTSALGDCASPLMCSTIPSPRGIASP